MPPRHVALMVAGLAVLGLGLYLFVEVRAVEVSSVEVSSVEAVEGRAARATDVPQRTSGPDVKLPPKPVVRSNPAPSRPPNDVGATSARDRPTTQADVPLVDAGLPANLAIMTNDQLMPEANKALDRGELELSLEIASKVLKDDPSNVWMLRVMVSAACKQADATLAQKHYLPLPASDREQMAERCSRYGITLTEPIEGSADVRPNGPK